MIDFEKELEQYKPTLEITDLETELSDYELKDMIDLIKNMMDEKK